MGVVGLPELLKPEMYEKPTSPFFNASPGERLPSGLIESFILAYNTISDSVTPAAISCRKAALDDLPERTKSWSSLFSSTRAMVESFG